MGHLTRKPERSEFQGFFSKSLIFPGRGVDDLNGENYFLVSNFVVASSFETNRKTLFIKYILKQYFFIICISFLCYYVVEPFAGSFVL